MRRLQSTLTAACATVLAVTFIAKAYALAMTVPVVVIIHPAFGVRMGPIIMVAMLVELGAFVIWAMKGEKAFLATACSLGAIFLMFHSWMSIYDIQSPCACMGGLFHGSKEYGQFEQAAAIGFAVVLFIAGLIGCQVPFKR